MERTSICDDFGHTDLIMHQNEIPSSPTIKKFIKSGSVMERHCSGRPQSGQNEENVAAVREAFDLSQKIPFGEHLQN